LKLKHADLKEEKINHQIDEDKTSNIKIGKCIAKSNSTLNVAYETSRRIVNLQIKNDYHQTK
jgi:stress response protein YsnF